MAEPVACFSYYPADHGADWREAAVCIVAQQTEFAGWSRHKSRYPKNSEYGYKQPPIPLQVKAHDQKYQSMD